MITDMNRFQISPAYSKYKEKILIQVKLKANAKLVNLKLPRKAVSHQITGRSVVTPKKLDLKA